MVDSGLSLPSSVGPKAYRQSLAIGLGVVTLGVLFYLVIASGMNRDLVVVGAVWVVMLISLKDHRYLLIGWFVVAPYFPSAVRGQFNPAVNISHNLFIPFIALVTLGVVLLRRARIAWGKDDVLFLGFVLYAAFSAFYTSGGRYHDLKAIYAIHLLPYLLYATTKQLRIDQHILTVLGYACLFHLTTLTVMAYGEYTTGLSLYTQVLIWRDVGMGRIAGPFGSPIILGLCVSFLSLYLYLGYRLGLISRSAFGLMVLLSAALYVLTFTRSVWLGVLVSTFYLLFKAPGKPAYRAVMLLAFVSALATVTLYLLLDPVFADRLSNPQNANFRIVMAYGSLELFAQYPLFGSGFGTFDSFILKYLTNMLGIYNTMDGSHMTLLTILAELGMVGTVLLLAFVYTSLSQSARQTARALSPNQRLVVLANSGFLLAFAVNAFLIDMRYFSLAYSWLFISLGVIHNVRRAESSLLE